MVCGAERRVETESNAMAIENPIRTAFEVRERANSGDKRSDGMSSNMPSDTSRALRDLELIHRIS
jgi:hypothetical protein